MMTRTLSEELSLSAGEFGAKFSLRINPGDLDAAGVVANPRLHCRAIHQRGGAVVRRRHPKATQRGGYPARGDVRDVAEGRERADDISGLAGGDAVRDGRVRTVAADAEVRRARLQVVAVDVGGSFTASDRQTLNQLKALLSLL